MYLCKSPLSGEGLAVFHTDQHDFGFASFSLSRVVLLDSLWYVCHVLSRSMKLVKQHRVAYLHKLGSNLAVVFLGCPLPGLSFKSSGLCRSMSLQNLVYRRDWKFWAFEIWCTISNCLHSHHQPSFLHTLSPHGIQGTDQIWFMSFMCQTC